MTEPEYRYEPQGYFDERDEYIPACEYCWDEGWVDTTGFDQIIPCKDCNPYGLAPEKE